jgi:hypothetical protein
MIKPVSSLDEKLPNIFWWRPQKQLHAKRVFGSRLEPGDARYMHG